AITGTWSGTVDAGGQQVLLVFDLSTDNGSLTATMDSPAQGATGIPVEEAVFEDGRLTMHLPQMGASYTGDLADDATAIEGVFSQGGMDFDLDLTRGRNVTETRRPQDPQPPYPYEVEEIRFTNPDAGITLAGTITRPGGEGPFPAVVLISGSGQQNRDEEVFGHRPFHVLADALTRSGIAVLRYDDRGVGESDGAETLADMTTRDSAGDAAAALAFLEDRAYVDPRRAGLIGHSEGALIALMIATGGQTDESGRPVVPIDVDPDFIVLLAGNGVPGDELLLMQSRAILEASGASSEQIEAVAAANRRIYDLALSGAPRDEVATEIDEILTDAGVPANQIELQRNQILSPWIEFFLRYDPASDLRRVEDPVLALIGGLDLQVPAEENLPAIRTALAEAPVEDVTVRELPGLNHLFQPAQTGAVEEYAQIETTFDPSVLELVAEWIVERFGVPNG
ncbi:MAG: alpha/beta hydrolase family protein, partial [Spirochaetota bacterium]